MSKPFKVFNSEKQTGVMASSLADLRNAIRVAFNVLEDVIPCLADGTRIENEEYFQSLAANERITYLVVYIYNNPAYDNNLFDNLSCLDNIDQLDEFIDFIRKSNYL
ncbi:hypothetical protein PsunGV_gp036 [Pseudalatia unipuncta granulovirus]|jgi:hypothetical protein|uniref:CIDE-N domain-containing protein n=1 Tax=Pseudalatia unipuncta granulosis virus TaxID=36355 RepID=B6S6Q5_GVPU|nr:hypothetical protein PsunGV_gp036 [Pseudalatia unipuncta granulovirus]ACH69386.1 unknown [Pseudalatia unipuncta granulovirus]